MHRYTTLFAFLACIVVACNNNPSGVTTATDSAAAYAATAELPNDTSSALLPEIIAYQQTIQRSLQQPVPVLLLQDSSTPAQKTAEALCLNNKQFTQYVKDTIRNIPFRNEIFNIYQARSSDLNETTEGFCRDGGCYKVEMYNYALNLTTVGLVNINSKIVLQVIQVPETQPEIPAYLKTLAISLAAQNELLQKALGFKPGEKDAVMSATKTALNHSRCERSRHLCVAPTFVKNDKALWAIVDLTDLKIAGIRWTNVGDAGPSPVITERKLQNEKITECFCKTESVLDRNGWKMGYMLTSSDGLRISNVQYNNKGVISNAKLVDWHVSYSNSDGFGYSDAIGCPYFSTAAVIAIEPPRILDLWEDGKKAGFVLEQNFYSESWPAPCNYNYQQRYEFFNDGRFRVSCASLGRGCGNDGTYRPVLRIAFAGTNKSVSGWTGNEWKTFTTEQWQQQLPNTLYTDEGYQYKIENANGLNYYMEPGRGQFKDGGRGDRAFTYITVNKPGRDEGESDLVTIGPCCNTDYHQGPEKYIEPSAEPLVNEALVLWYVPQLKNDDTKGNEYCWAESYVKNGVISTRSFPCFAGPMFIPVK
jgi:hypothetical protein